MTPFAGLSEPPMARGNRFVGLQPFDMAEEFRARAAECQRLADCWRDEGKRQYEELARQWLELAQRALERYGKNTGRGAIARRADAAEPPRSVLVHG
jgi:hypothetical protein